MAQRAARLGAGRNAVLLMGNISVGPDGRFVDVAKANIRVDAVLEDFEEISSAFDPKTQIVTVSLAVPLYGAHGVIHVLGANSAQPSTPATPSQNQDAKDAAAETVSVIVIDARGTAIKPCLLPQIVGGKPAGVIFTARESDLDNHPAAIYVTLPAVKADNAEGTFDAPLQAPSPAVLVLKAGDVDEKTPGAIVLNTQESAKLQMHPQWRQLLSAGRLIVITGRDQ
jgi:hypothetical protein